MSRNRTLRALALGLWLAAVPAFAQDAAPTGEEAAPAPAIAVTSDASADAAIAGRIRALYDEIEGLRDVGVSVEAGVVTLTGTVVDAEAQGEAEALAQRVTDVAAVENEIALDTNVQRRLAPVLKRTEARLWNLLGLLPLLLIAILVFGLVLLLGLFVASRSWPWDRLAPNGFIAQLMRQAVRLVFIALGLVLALDVLGATALLGTVLGAAGLVGLAVGFAVRDTVENYIASILLSLRQPFRPNDLVLIEGIEGHVTAMTSRATVLTTLESNHVRIPNATVFKAVITNYTRNPERRFDFRVGVETDDLGHAVALGLKTIGDLDFILAEPEPLGFIEEVGDSAIILFFAGWIDQRVTSWPKAKSEAIRKVMIAFEAASIGVPEPIYRLRFDGQGAEVRVQPGDDGARQPRPPFDPRASDAISDVALDAEQTVKARVDAERTKVDDLLSASAPQEIAG